jgi:hypothetical protein
MADDDTTTGSSDGDGQSSEEAAGTAPDPQKVIEDLRKRQSGADRAKAEALAERDALQRRLDALLSGKSGEQSADSPKDEAAIRAEVAKEYEERLAKAQQAAKAEALDARFPEARKRFPEITDAAKLAELETMFGEAPPPKPIGNNPPKDGGGKKNIEDMTVAELRASLDEQAASLFRG